ncbi:amino acid adenylation [Coniophora puteana RWD-64-598 SS2]|uniref:Amino acid adenylation n=1 Tax=Coniophora puteana (strain RWD-64-598) TaxID=741705 RepID=A0A5M3N2S1_CONPW|nr:amino acid adenylation [Coniophora puteana RWD-64-598 SS2]EIW85668.1 amino acid adenylation [Coniophora puteana RWD-64-598 SS2]
MFDLGGDNWAFNIVIHHIIIDEASLGTFFYELFSLYIKGAGTLPEVQYHYSDFCEWLGETAEKREELRDEHLQYWAEYLQETQPLHLTLATPSERELAPVTQIDAKISESALESFVKVIQGANATQFAGFFAAYNILLHKYSDQNSFVVGTAVTQRNVPALSNVIGFFANMLPVKTEINDQDSFEQYLGQFKDNVLACLQHDDVTYEDIVTQAKTSSHGRSFFKHLFAPGGVNMETISQLEAANLDTKAIITLPNGEEQYEFLMTVHYKSGHCLLRFDNHMFTEEAARQFLDAYIALIEKLGREPDRKIAEISAVSDAEHDRILKELSSNADFAVSETCLHHLFETQVKKTPRFTAVEFEDQSLTYLELNKRANQIAKSLIQQDIKQGDIIAVCFDRGVHQIAGILAVLKAGCTYVPLDPDDPTLRKELMVEECGAKVLISTTNHSRDFQKSLASKVLVSDHYCLLMIPRLSRFDAADFAVEGLTPSSLAYVMFTSGSTGKPKGVMIEHRAISNLIQNSQVYGYQQGARVLSSLAYTFDPFVADVFGTLTNGATLVTGRKELVLGDIPKALRSLRISVLHVTPSILAVVPPDDYPCLDTVVVAGEALGKKVIEDWAPRVNFRNMYGPTEASVDCISVHVTSAALTGVIGRPMANCRIYILDKQLRPTPIGVEGELHIGGIQLARGYLNQPELTEQAFIPNPFVPGERLYKTGDIALYRTDGNIEYCGRADRQIKLRGQRIELGEVEDVIAKYPAVQRAAAVIRTLQDALAIVAFVEYKNEVENIEDEKEGLKMFVSERLPRFMYPSLIAALPELPTSRSGKIDRNTLKSMDLAAFAPDLTNDMGQPSSDVEVELMSIFSKVLKVDPNSFGVSHDLFQVGMNSLMAVQAAGVVSKTFNVHIGLNNIYLR